uniref:OFD1 centriole and centriolar satellite protein n=2 Tax=Testudinoidea TaxID=8486 RepID=A0A8C4Y085_9SAUR
MASSEFQALSQDELRKRLYQTFKNRGVLDTLKTQLRNQLIHELMHPILSGELQPQPVSSEGSSLLIGASNSLVADHLRSCGYEYSLSVFYPESGLEKEKVSSIIYYARDVKDDIHIGLCFLIQMLMELTEHHLCKESRNTETQTISIPSYRESLVEKLQLIDEQFADIYPQHQKFESLEVKLIEYRKEIEDQLQAEMSAKLQHFKEVEIAKIRMEEKAQCQKEVSDLHREFERTNQAKSEALIAREKNAIERLQKQQEIEAKEVYTQRQSLLKDIEMIRTREAELKQRIESFELAQKLQEEKNKAVDDALRRREIAVKNIEETYDQKLKNELLKYQLELKEEYIARTTRVTEDEKKNKEKAILLREEAIAVNSKKEELKQVVSHAKELELELDSVKAQVLLVNKQNQLLTEKLKEIADYPLLKEEKLELQVQNKLLKQQLEETRNENLHFRDKLTQPSAEHVACQAELRRVEHAKKLEQDEFETRKQLLEKQLQSEVERCGQLKIQLLDYETTIRKLHVQVEDLKLQLKQTQTVLENEVYRNPKPSLVDRSVIDFTGDRIVPHDIYVDGAFLKNRAVTDIVVADDVPNVGYRQHSRNCNSSPDSDLEFVAKTKARIKELEKEAEYLEEAYRNYQHRVIQGAVASRTPTKTKSPLPLRNAVRFPLASQHRVMFVEDNLGSQHFSLSNPRGPRYVTPGHDDVLKNHLTTPRRRVSSSRRLSSTPLSKVERNNNSHILPEGKLAFLDLRGISRYPSIPEEASGNQTGLLPQLALAFPEPPSKQVSFPEVCWVVRGTREQTAAKLVSFPGLLSRSPNHPANRREGDLLARGFGERESKPGKETSFAAVCSRVPRTTLQTAGKETCLFGERESKPRRSWSPSPVCSLVPRTPEQAGLLPCGLQGGSGNARANRGEAGLLSRFALAFPEPPLKPPNSAAVWPHLTPLAALVAVSVATLQRWPYTAVLIQL